MSHRPTVDATERPLELELDGETGTGTDETASDEVLPIRADAEGVQRVVRT